ncbi:MAG: hypothetical protein RLZZ381_3113, partial [Cyanobacteriota bacterium]
KLKINTKFDKISISVLANGFQFEDSSGSPTNKNLNDMITSGYLTPAYVLEVNQDAEGYDLEDRLEKLTQLVKTLI